MVAVLAYVMLRATTHSRTFCLQSSKARAKSAKGRNSARASFFEDSPDCSDSELLDSPLSKRAKQGAASPLAVSTSLDATDASDGQQTMGTPPHLLAVSPASVGEHCTPHAGTQALPAHRLIHWLRPQALVLQPADRATDMRSTAGLWELNISFGRQGLAVCRKVPAYAVLPLCHAP